MGDSELVGLQRTVEESVALKGPFHSALRHILEDSNPQ
jgi:hypothetical protein